MVVCGLATVAVYHWLSLRIAFLLSLLLIPSLSIVSNWILSHRFAAWGLMVPLVAAVIMIELYTTAAFYLSFYKKISTLRERQRFAAEKDDNPDAISGLS